MFISPVHVSLQKQPANNSFMKILTALSLAALLPFAAGCSAFRDSHQTLTVQTDPPHANVWVNRVSKGEAPVQVSVLRNKEVDVRVEKDGFQTANQTVRYHLNTTGCLDIAGACFFILPVIGMMTPGHDSLDETTITLHLSPAPEGAAKTAEPQPAFDNNKAPEKTADTVPF
jgi:hypothetical protein